MTHGSLFPDWPFAPLIPESYQFVMADPPWNFGQWSAKGYRKNPSQHYEVMAADPIKALPVHDLADTDCLLWLWATHPMLPQALEVMQAWGFTFKTSGTWVKTTKTGKIGFGTGYILRSASEPFLIGTRGRPKTTRATRSAFMGLLRRHSEKPEEAYAAAEAMMPEVRRCELFSRKTRPGWDTWGNERTKFDDLVQKSLAESEIQKSDEGEFSAQNGPILQYIEDHSHDELDDWK